MFLAGESEPVPSGYEGIISWLADLGWVGIALIAIWAFATDRLYTRSQVEKLLAAKDEVIAVWQGGEQRSIEALKAIIDELQPIASGNEAVLKAMERMQDWQSEERIRRMRRDET